MFMKLATPRQLRRLLPASLVLATSFSFGQSMKDIVGSKETPILYLGIDFTKAKLIGDETESSTDIRDRQFDGINGLILEEPKKFDVRAALHKSMVDHDLSLVEKKNALVNPDEIKSGSSADFHRLKAEDISSLVNGYNFGDKKGIGLLLVMEGMDKSAKECAIWVTFIDLKARKVILTERIEGKAGPSFGFRNFWASGVKSVLENVEKKRYKEWEKQYK
jgi:hypothetical protein